MSALADYEILRRDLHALSAQPVHFLKQADRVNDDAIADDTHLLLPEHAAGNEGQDVFRSVVDDGVAGIGPALGTGDNVAAGTSSVRHWHPWSGLPRLHRACPSTALDEHVREKIVDAPRAVKERHRKVRPSTRPIRDSAGAGRLGPT